MRFQPGRSDTARGNPVSIIRATQRLLLRPDSKLRKCDTAPLGWAHPTRGGLVRPGRRRLLVLPGGATNRPGSVNFSDPNCQNNSQFFLRDTASRLGKRSIFKNLLIIVVKSPHLFHLSAVVLSIRSANRSPGLAIPGVLEGVRSRNLQFPFPRNEVPQAGVR